MAIAAPWAPHTNTETLCLHCAKWIQTSLKCNCAKWELYLQHQLSEHSALCYPVNTFLKSKVVSSSSGAEFEFSWFSSLWASLNTIDMTLKLILVLGCLFHFSWYCSRVTSVVSNSVRPHRRQPTRLPRPWDSPGKNTGVDCHFLLQCMKVKSESEVTQSCLTLSDPMNCSLPGSSVHGIFQARVLEWGAIAFS